MIGIEERTLSNEKSFSLAGPVVALVTSLEDPDKLGRIKVKFPWLDDKIESSWARLAAPFAGKDRGIQFLPEVGDEVLVIFQMGNFQKPIVLGGLWNGVDVPPSDGQEGKNHLKVIQSTAKHKIEFSDNKDDSYLLITDGETKSSIKINLKEESIEIQSSKKVQITSADGEIVLKGKKVILEGSSEVEVKASSGSVKINGQSSVDIKASTINLN